jgi:NNP family nitrate/nitrite transporter-like MFS transporter
VPFLLLFLVLFAASGIGNGSTFRTIGVIFDRTQAGPVLGWTRRSPPTAPSSHRW